MAGIPAQPQDAAETRRLEPQKPPAGLPADSACGAAREPAPQALHHPATAIDSRLLRKAFAQLEPQSDKAAAYFYGNLFLRHPEMRAMFPLAMDAQRRRLFEALAGCVWGAGQEEALTAYLADLARDHRKFGVTGKHYRHFSDALLASLHDFRLAWGEETWAAWEALVSRITTTMASAADAAASEPAWWLGEVVRHERRGSDVAVLTVRAEGAQPLRYRPGQCISIQVPQWPRVWRCYSVANAPRADGTLDLHVRAVPGGRVSCLLVEQARPGDGLVIGPARGSMTMAAAAGSGSILCVAGGTGLAPLKALAEELAAAGAGAPPVRLLVGARHHGDLYDLPDLERLAAGCPSLTVIPVAPARGLARPAALPAAAAAQLTPDTADIFVCGPDGMVRATIRRLAALAPGARIHADVPGARRPGRRSRQPSAGTAGETADGRRTLRPALTASRPGSDPPAPAARRPRRARAS